MKAKEFIPASKPRNFVAKNQKTAGAGAHRDKKKEQKQGYEKHKNKVDEGVSYGSMPADAVRKLLSVYNDQSQGVELYRDSEGAERLGKALDDAAKKLDVAQYMRSLYNSASHSAHMDYDTNPGDFKNWFNYVGKHLEGLDKLHREKGSYDDEPDTYVDKESFTMDERIRDPEDWDEGNTEPGNNFAIYINGKKWKVFPGPYGAYADSSEEEKEFYRLKDMARRKSQATGKKWEVYKTGEPATK
jgi:hypothetical protein